VEEGDRADGKVRSHPVPVIAGPRIYTFEELLRTIAREAGLKRILIPVPFAAWQN
jgi:hypothetical protein